MSFTKLMQCWILHQGWAHDHSQNTPENTASSHHSPQACRSQEAAQERLRRGFAHCPPAKLRQAAAGPSATAAGSASCSAAPGADPGPSPGGAHARISPAPSGLSVGPLRRRVNTEEMAPSRVRAAGATLQPSLLSLQPSLRSRATQSFPACLWRLSSCCPSPGAQVSVCKRASLCMRVL